MPVVIIGLLLAVPVLALGWLGSQDVVGGWTATALLAGWFALLLLGATAVVARKEHTGFLAVLRRGLGVGPRRP